MLVNWTVLTESIAAVRNAHSRNDQKGHILILSNSLTDISQLWQIIILKVCSKQAKVYNGEICIFRTGSLLDYDLIDETEDI